MYFEFDSDPDPKDSSSQTDKSRVESIERISSSKCSTPLGTTLRNRRYSIHSDIPSRSISYRPHPTSGSNCDLALLAKKKLDEVDDTVAMNDVYEPDIKISKAAKHSSSDLRREVLLHSMQRSLSMSSEDLSTFASPASMNSLGAGTSRCQSSLSRRSFPSSSRSGCDMEVLSEDFGGDSSAINGSSYKPRENQIQNNSRMIYTATNSLAGSRFSENRLNYLAKRQNSSNLSCSSPSSSSVDNRLGCESNKSPTNDTSSDDASRPYLAYNLLPMSGSHCPALNTGSIITPTLTIWSPSPLKKRCHSSPTKYHTNTPYSFGGHQNCMASMVTHSREHNGPLFSTGTFSPPPDPTNKKFKGNINVPLPKLDLFDPDAPSSSTSNTVSIGSADLNDFHSVDMSTDNSQTSYNSSVAVSHSPATISVPSSDQSTPNSESFVSTKSLDSSAVPQVVSQNPARNDRELGQLAKDFDRLKTPFQ